MQRIVRHDELRRVATRAGPRAGAPALREALGLVGATRTALEQRFLALCRRAGLERPLVNALAAGFEVDFLWPRRRLAVETDGFGSHATRAGFERDRERDAALARAGIRVVRFSARQLEVRPGEVLETLRAVGLR